MHDERKLWLKNIYLTILYFIYIYISDFPRPSPGHLSSRWWQRGAAPSSSQLVGGQSRAIPAFRTLMHPPCTSVVWICRCSTLLRMPLGGEGYAAGANICHLQSASREEGRAFQLGPLNLTLHPGDLCVVCGSCLRSCISQCCAGQG